MKHKLKERLTGVYDLPPLPSKRYGWNGYHPHVVTLKGDKDHIRYLVMYDDIIMGHNVDSGEFFRCANFVHLAGRICNVIHAFFYHETVETDLKNAGFPDDPYANIDIGAEFNELPFRRIKQ